MRSTKSFGFTGTRKGMTPAQEKKFCAVIRTFRNFHDLTFHHGDCTGSDEQAHNIVAQFFIPIEIHPPTNPKHRAFSSAKVIHSPNDYHVRNAHIVEASDALFATPAEDEEILRSGTWSTLRAAARKGIPAFVITTDGTIRPFERKE